MRCGKIFEVYPNGKYPRVEECVYHWGRANKRKSKFKKSLSTISKLTSVIYEIVRPGDSCSN